MLRQVSIQLTLLGALACAGTAAFADTDPSVHQIYEAAAAGHLAQAQQMMDEVLRDHPNSGKAHYVAAELYAKEGNPSMARQELGNAERLDPGLGFAKPESVRELRQELSARDLSAARSFGASPYGARTHASFPWGTALVVMIFIGILWAVMRRRAAPSSAYSQYPGQYPGGAPGTAGYMGAPGVGPTTGGGSGIMGNLGTGLAIGAGVAAGEELVRHVFDSDRHPGGVLPAQNDGFSDAGFNPADNGDMGGGDFGTSDSSSWDDGGSGGGDVGGDGWT